MNPLIEDTIPMRHCVNLLDTWIDNLDLAGAKRRIDDFVRTETPHQIVTANVDFLRLAHECPEFRGLINTADLVVADGMPLLWASRFLGNPLPERITGVDLIVESARLSAAKGYGIFMLGAAPGIAEEAANVLRMRIPCVRIVGTYSPPFGPFSRSEDETMVRLIQEMRPSILLVAFGAPKQDEWIRKQMHRLDVPVCIGVGGAFDFLAGRIARAPVWMQNRGLEWLYRVSQEPTRLWKRYFVDDLPVFFRLMAQRSSATGHIPVSGIADTRWGVDADSLLSAGLDVAPAQGPGANVA